MADKNFGNRLQEIRKKKNFTQQQLADLLGLKNKTTLSSWEVGKSEPDIKSIKDLCSILNVNINELFDFEQETSNVSTTAQVIGYNGEIINYNDEKLKNEINTILEEIDPKCYLSDKSGNKEILSEIEYNFLLNVLKNYRESIK